MPTAVKIALVILLVLVIVYFIGKKAGKNVLPEAVTIPDDRPGGKGAISFNPGAYTDALRKDIYAFWPRNMKPYNDLLTLSDAQFVVVYNDWNKRYFKEHQETLRQAMNAEIYLNREPINAIFKRMDRLNLV